MATQPYRGGCHCGRVRFEVEVDLDSTMTCNCSRCHKLGVVLAFAPADRFQLQQGHGDLSEYRFNRHVIGHFFCTTCGVEPFARGAAPDGTPSVAVNVRCLDDVDTDTLHSMAYDGRAA